MDLETALTAFQKLEAETRTEAGTSLDDDDEEDSWTTPVYNVRLDAGSDRDEERTLRIRVVVNAFSDEEDTRQRLQAVNELAREHALAMRIDNNALELT